MLSLLTVSRLPAPSVIRELIKAFHAPAGHWAIAHGNGSQKAFTRALDTTPCGWQRNSQRNEADLGAAVLPAACQEHIPKPSHCSLHALAKLPDHGAGMKNSEQARTRVGFCVWPRFTRVFHGGSCHACSGLAP